MAKKTRMDLPTTVDPSTLKYIKQVTGQEPAFQPMEADPSLRLSEKQRAFIRAYGSSGGITKVALKESGVSRSELETWKTETPFQKAYKEAQEDWVEELRKAAMLRATSKSDVLLMFLLKAMKPEVFDEDVRKQQYVGLQGNRDAIPVRATLVRDNTFNLNLSSEQAESLRDVLVASDRMADTENDEES
jgi:hypothetical protein